MGKKLFVGNLSYNASEQGVADLFAQYGAVDSVKIITDRETGRSKGFAFVARQKHLRVEGEDCFIDLVFYNYLLKCFVLVDLKVGKLEHQDVGQMDMYVRVYDEQHRQESDNPTLGLILCSK